MPRTIAAETLKPATAAILAYLAETYDAGTYTQQKRIEHHITENKGLPVMESLEECFSHKWVETHEVQSTTMRLTAEGLEQHEALAKLADAAAIAANEKKTKVAAKQASGGIEIEGPTEIPRAARGKLTERARDVKRRGGGKSGGL